MKHPLFLCFLLFPVLLFSRGNGRFRHYTTEDGLAQNSVYCIVQDKQGFMWIGTSDGLCRYDGYKFTVFRPDPKDSSTISNNVIRSMIVDREGKIWVGTREGLNCYDPVSGKFRRFYAREKDKNALSDNVILALAEDPQGRIWVASLSTGICIYDKKTGKFTRLQNDPNDNTTIIGNDIRGMVLDNKGHMWLSTWKSGVCEIDPATFKCHTRLTPDKFAYPNVKGGILIDKHNNVWFGTWMRGLEKYDPVASTITHEIDNASIPDMHTGMIWAMSWDKNGRMLIATAEQGLIVFDPETKAYRKYEYDPDDILALNDKSVWCVMQDRSGQVWTGTWRGGVNVLDERLDRFDLVRFDPKDSTALPAATVWTMCSDGGNGLWLGTAAGPVHYDPTTGKFFHPALYPKDPQAPAPNADVQAMCRDGNGNIWMGTAGDGLFFYDTAKHAFKHYPKNPVGPHTIADEIINCVNTDKQGRVWIGSGHEPMQMYDPSIDGFISFPLAEKDSLTYGVYCIANSANKDELLIGFLTGDAMRFNMKTKTYTRFWKNTTSISVSAMYEDKFGGVWIGTNGSGLIYVKNNSATYFSEKDSLPNNVINGIVPGAHDEFWLSCNRGLCRFDPFSHSVRSYTPEDGLQGYEYNQGSNARTPDGKLWFGGVKGFTGFYPKDILPNTTTAPAVITSFTVLNKIFALDTDILYTNNISLTYLDYFFSFEFAGLEFTNSQRNRYKYKMEGFDPDWIDAGDRRFATYTNLDPGDYTFHVIASNNDGYWGGKEAVIHISISPPFWRTNWFYSLCGVTIVLLIWGFIRRRERQLRKDKEVLEAKVSERTYELNREKEKVTAAHKDIKDSINYAQRIQYALLAHEELLRSNLKEHFIFFLPKDVVSGDFYWGTRPSPNPSPTGRGRGGAFYLAVCDSTGHGVPGAFMSLLNISFLNEAINEKQLTDPDKVFDHVRERLIRNISQDGEGKDGMDAILAEFVPGSNEIRYAAAHNAPLIVRGTEVIQLEADKMPVGKGEREMPFSLRTMNVQKNDVVYFYTDGFADQFGGPQGKKYKEANLRKFFQQIAQLPMKEQREKLAKQFEEWKGELEQIDDVLIVGVRI